MPKTRLPARLLTAWSSSKATTPDGMVELLRGLAEPDDGLVQAVVGAALAELIDAGAASCALPPLWHLKGCWPRTEYQRARLFKKLKSRPVRKEFWHLPADATLALRLARDIVLTWLRAFGPARDAGRGQDASDAARTILRDAEKLALVPVDEHLKRHGETTATMRAARRAKQEAEGRTDAFRRQVCAEYLAELRDHPERKETRIQGEIAKRRGIATRTLRDWLAKFPQ